MTEKCRRHVADTTQNVAIWAKKRHADIRHMELSLQEGHGCCERTERETVHPVRRYPDPPLEVPAALVVGVIVLEPAHLCGYWHVVVSLVVFGDVPNVYPRDLDGAPQVFLFEHHQPRCVVSTLGQSCQCHQLPFLG